MKQGGSKLNPYAEVLTEAMNQGGSKLNPYAEAYIPVSRREPRPENRSSAFLKQPYPLGVLSPRQSEFSISPSYHSGGLSQIADDAAFPFSPSYHSGGPSQIADDAAEEQLSYEHFSNVMNHLRIQFPGVADDFLAEAYWQNGGDFGAAVSMMYDLEGGANESSESLPDSLDIGDISESGPSAQFSSLKQKNVPFTDKSSFDTIGSSRSAS